MCTQYSFKPHFDEDDQNVAVDCGGGAGLWDRKGPGYGGIVGEEEDFKLDGLENREPVQILKDGDDMVTGAGVGVGEETDSRVFDVLKLI